MERIIFVSGNKKIPFQGHSLTTRCGCSSNIRCLAMRDICTGTSYEGNCIMGMVVNDIILCKVSQISILKDTPKKTTYVYMSVSLKSNSIW